MPVVLDSILVAAAGGILFGRAVFVATNWAYFHAQLPQAFQVWRGGLSAHGVLLGAVGGLALYARLRRIDPWALLDLLAPGGALVAASAWLGCLWAGCAWGLETGPDQGLLWALSLELPDLYGLRAPRVAVQAMGAVWSLLMFGATLGVGSTGGAFSLWLLLFAIGDFALGFFRGDPLPKGSGLAVPQVVDTAVFFLALALWTSRGRRSRRGGG